MALAEAEAARPAAAQEAGGDMKVKHFLSELEHDRIHRTIQSAEEGTSGDIVVFITHRRIEDPLATANHEFEKLRLDAETKRKSLLIYLAPKSQKFAVVGGITLHEKVGQAWWDHLSALLTRHFKEGKYTDGLVAAIEKAGHALKTHFPAASTDRSGENDIVEE